jgi:hypothetical protein
VGKVIPFPKRFGGSVKLTINLAADTMAVLRKIAAKRRGGSLTEAIRRAIACYKFIVEELDKGNQIVVIEKKRWWRGPRIRVARIEGEPEPLSKTM